MAGFNILLHKTAKTGNAKTKTIPQRKCQQIVVSTMVSMLCEMGPVSLHSSPQRKFKQLMVAAMFAM